MVWKSHKCRYSTAQPDELAMRGHLLQPVLPAWEPTCAVQAALALIYNADRPGICTNRTGCLHLQRCTTLRTAPLASPSLVA